MLIWLLTTIFLALHVSQPVSATGQTNVRVEKQQAQARLICEKTAAAPGSTVWIAITFNIDEHWHLYWDGQNDSGLPVTAKWTLPEHVKLGDLHWPTPKRAVNSTIQAIDYIYEKKVTAIAELTLGEELKPEQTITIAAGLKWLVCNEQCKAGSQDVSLQIKIVPTGSSITNSDDATLFADARKTIPKPAKEGESVISRRWERNILVLTVRDSTGLVFYPDAKCAPMTDAIAEGESKSGELKLGFEAKSGTIAPVSGIVEVRRLAPKQTEYYTVTIPGVERKE